MELYIHIPFCVKKCEYCSFVSFQASEIQKKEYIDAVLREAEIRKDECTEAVTTVFIGGGTPSLLSPDLLAYLIEGIRKQMLILPDAEFTMEANPGTVSETLLREAGSLGVNRLSFGIQARQERLLNLLGRIHTWPDAVHAVEAACKAGIRNINLDLIFGIPGQTIREWEETIRAAVSLQPCHISAYGLIPEEGTPLYRKLADHEYQLPDPDTEREMYDLAIRVLASSGFHQYEISNFSLDGCECLHNIGYWTQIPYIGLGVSAASMLLSQEPASGMRYLRKKNPDSLRGYLSMIREQDFSAASVEEVCGREARFETMMLALRMNRGIREERFRQMHGVSLDACYGTRLREMEQQGLTQYEGGAWSLTRRGFDIQNSILLELMEE